MPSENERVNLESPEALREQIRQSSETSAYLNERLDFLMKQLQKNTALVGSLERALLSKDAELNQISRTAGHYSKPSTGRNKSISPDNSSTDKRRPSAGCESYGSRLHRYGRLRAASSAVLITPLTKVHEPSLIPNIVRRDSPKSEPNQPSALTRVGASARLSRVRSIKLHDENNEAMLKAKNKMDETSQGAVRLRSILDVKTAELNELMAQLQLAYEALENVEKLAEEIEASLMEIGSGARLAKEETAEESALLQHQDDTTINAKIPSDDQQLVTTIPATLDISPEQINQSLLQLDKLIEELGLDRDAYMKAFEDIHDIRTVRKSVMHLEIAKTIQASVCNNVKRRTNLLNGSRRDNELEEIKTLGKKIRESIPLWEEYTYSLPLIIGGVDILCHLDNEDVSLTRNLPSISGRTNLSTTSNKSANTAPTPSPTLSSRIPRPSSSKSPPAMTPRRSLVGSTSGTTTKAAPVTHRLSVMTQTTKITERSRVVDVSLKPLSPTSTKDPNIVPAVTGKKIAKKISYTLSQMNGEKGFPMPRISQSKRGKRTVMSRG
ncbi:hypothetical protein BC937DRAFT_91527 [Endogone sp. FLAS-F59071]|nr:hypothetical protein BC937DRAFT_91527 [Endogone sp. FLAS-F59071]|eukprot:RUS16185.1 hypothetical protein BC937DRAFT_91527 [Endogone sp. FLAS-F59071]